MFFIEPLNEGVFFDQRRVEEVDAFKQLVRLEQGNYVSSCYKLSLRAITAVKTIWINKWMARNRESKECVLSNIK